MAARGTPSVSDGKLAAVSAAGAVGFVGCFIAAASLYPGGTWFDRRAPGHSFWHNFLCDLMQVQAMSGADNPVGSVVAQAGMVSMLVAMAAFFVLVARLDPDSRAATIARRAGVFACALGCSVPLVRADWFHVAHLVVVVASFIPALVATVAAFVLCLRAAAIPWWVKALALLTLGAAVVDFVGYVLGYGMAFRIVPVYQHRLLNFSLPVIQRVATLGLVAWVLAVSAHTLSGRSSPGNR